MTEESTGDSREGQDNGLIRSLRQSIKDRDSELDALREQVEELSAQLESEMPERTSTPDIEGTEESDPGVEAEAGLEPQPNPHEALQSVANLSNRVASVANGQSPFDPSKAESPEELREMMAKQGLLADHSSY